MSSGMFIPTRHHKNMVRTIQSDYVTTSGGSTETVDNIQYAPLPSRRTISVVDNECLAHDVYKLTLRDSFIAHHAQPAQFVNLYAPDSTTILPRPFGVAEVHDDEFTLIFAVVGKGTQSFARLRAGDQVDTLGPLGLGFDIRKPAHYVLVSGGLGVPPLLCAAQALSVRDDVRVSAVLGYRDERFADDMMKHYVSDTHSIVNAEGTVITLLNRLEQEGVFSASDDEISALPMVILSCGPTPMMKAVAHWAADRNIDCQLSLEARMGCGYGTCVACVVDTEHGRLKVCNDGPVFTREQLGWR